MTITSMRSSLESSGEILLTIPKELIGPLRNAVQKLAGGIDFFALEQQERDGLDHALRHLWNPGEDADPTRERERTVPIEVLALAMRDRLAAKKAGEMVPPPRQPARNRRTSRQRVSKNTRPTVKISRLEHPASPSTESSATQSDGYRAPSKGRHTDVSR